jgi:hypothetical protein
VRVSESSEEMMVQKDDGNKCEARVDETGGVG